MSEPVLRPPQPPTSTARVVGLVLILPAFVLLIVSYIEPTLWVLRASFKSEEIIPLRDNAGNGGFTFDNFGDLFRGGFVGDLGAAFAFAAVPILAVLITAPVLAFAVHKGGTFARWVTRVVLALPLAAYAPAAVIATGILDYGFDAVRGLYWWATFGLVASLAVTAYLAALRRRDPGRQPWGALALAAGIAFVAVLTAAWQEFSYSTFVIPKGSSPPLGRLWFRAAQMFDFAPAVAGSAVILLVVMLLGLLVTVAIVLSGLRLEFDRSFRSADESTGWPPARLAGVIVGGVVLLVVASLTIYGLRSEFGHLFDRVRGDTSFADVVVNTWVPPLLSTMVGVFVAAAAAVGIAWLRPFGRHSEWLLVPFGLFLFVGLGPLAIRTFARRVDADATFLSLLPPWWVAVPALFVLTLLLRGQALRGEALRQEGRQVPAVRLLLPVLPMLAIVFGVTWVVQAQDGAWTAVVNSLSSRDYPTGPIALFGEMRFASVPVSLVLPAGVLVLALVLVVAAQLLYLDRIALRVGRPERDPDPAYAASESAQQQV